MRSFASVARSPQVPFANHVGAIAGILKQLGNGGRGTRQVGLVAGLALRWRVERVVECTKPDLNRIVAGQQHRARYRAYRRGVKTGELHASLSQSIQIGRLGDRAENSEIAESDVITNDQQNVGLLFAVLRVRRRRKDQESHGHRQKQGNRRTHEGSPQELKPWPNAKHRQAPSWGGLHVQTRYRAIVAGDS